MQLLRKRVASKIIFFNKIKNIDLNKRKLYAYYASVDTVSAITENKLSPSKNIYPNPTNNLLSIKSDNVLLGLSFTITDLLVRQILPGKLSNKITTINISTFSIGVYFFQVGQRK